MPNQPVEGQYVTEIKNYNGTNCAWDICPSGACTSSAKEDISGAWFRKDAPKDLVCNVGTRAAI
jgi:hypothetical protein